MEQPVKHHFSPAFSNKPWAVNDGKLIEMKRINGSVVPRRTHPNGTGYARQLYQIEGAPPDWAQYVELNVMRPLDMAASEALQHLLSENPATLAPYLRMAWSRYILSLMVRNPYEFNGLKRHMKELLEAGRQAMQENYASRRRPGDPPTFQEYHDRVNPAASGIMGASHLERFITHESFLTTILGMHWSKLHLKKSHVPLLNSDQPMDRPYGFSNPRAYIALPISPDMIFIAASDPYFGNSIAQEDNTKVAKSLNKVVVRQAREFVWASDESQLPFIERHMGKAELRPLMTEDQKAQAIAVVKGES